MEGTQSSIILRSSEYSTTMCYSEEDEVKYSTTICHSEEGEIAHRNYMCHLEEGEREHITTIRHVEEGEKEYSITMCNSEEGEITIESASTDHKDRNVFLAENSSHSRNQDYFSYDQVDLGSNVTFFSKRKDKDTVCHVRDTQDKITLGEVTPSHSKYQGNTNLLEDDVILEVETLSLDKTNIPENLTLVAVTPSPSGSRARLRYLDDNTSPSQEGIKVRKKSDLSVDERQEEGRRLSHRTPPASGTKTEMLMDSPLIYLPVNVDVSSLRDWDTHSMEGKKGALVEINNSLVSIFRYGSSLVATQASCPHAGGPLYEGDIEVLPDRTLCLRCPWHKWSFSLGRKVCGSNSRTRRTLFVEPKNTSLSISVEPSGSSGTCLHPPGRTDLRLTMYPVRIEDSGKVTIGFKSIHINTLMGETF